LSAVWKEPVNIYLTCYTGFDLKLLTNTTKTVQVTQSSVEILSRQAMHER